MHPVTDSQRAASPLRSALAVILFCAAAAFDHSTNTSDHRPAPQGCYPENSMPSNIQFVYTCMQEDGEAAQLDAARRSTTPTTKRRRRRSSPSTPSSTTLSTDVLSSSMEEDSATTLTANTEADAGLSTPPPHYIPPHQLPKFLFAPLPSLKSPNLLSSATPDALSRLPRLFIGQLKKDAAAETVTALLSALAPNVVIHHVEPLVNASTHQGRGCAWVYLHSVDNAAEVMALHHRVFLDFDEAGRLGYFLCEEADKDALRHFSEYRVGCDLSRRNRNFLPRQPLVVETPIGGVHRPHIPHIGVRPPPPPHEATLSIPALYHNQDASLSTPQTYTRPSWIPVSWTTTTAPYSADASSPMRQGYARDGMVLVAPRTHRNDPYYYPAFVEPPSYHGTVGEGL